MRRLSTLYPVKPGRRARQFRKLINGLLIKTKEKVKFTLEQATKVQQGDRGTAVLILQPRR
jgi:hypothetical protein